MAKIIHNYSNIDASILSVPRSNIVIEDTIQIHYIYYMYNFSKILGIS